MLDLVILSSGPAFDAEAGRLATTWHVPLADLDQAPLSTFRLVLGEAGPQLHYRDETWHTLALDFLQGDLARRGRQVAHELLLRACGVKRGAPIRIIDATAGLGRDSYLLASAGCQVVMLERSPVMAYLLSDALARLNAVNPLALTLVETDAEEYLAAQEEKVDVIYLDPMHPERKKSALVKLEMRLLRALVGPDLDSAALLTAALSKATRRVVVKRPLHAPTLTNRTPSFQFKGKHSRFDVYSLV